MKAIQLFFLAFFIVNTLDAQKIKEIKPDLKGKFSFAVTKRYLWSRDLNLVFGSNKTTGAMIDMTSGKILWEIKNKDFGIKDEIGFSWNQDFGYLTLEVTGKNTTKILIDEQTGKQISDITSSIKYSKLTPEEIKEITERGIFMPDSLKFNPNSYFSVFAPNTSNNKYEKWNDLSLVVGYPSESKTSAFGDKVTLSLTAKKADNTQVWKIDFKGKVVRPLCYDFANSGSLFGNNFVNLYVVGNKALIMYEGLACIDLENAKLLWQIDLNTSDVSIGLKAKQTVGLAAPPLIIDNSIIIADLTNNRNIKRIDINTGNILWESEKLDKNATVPQIHMSGENIICQIGGQLEKQEFIAGIGSNVSTCIAKSYFTEENDLICIDITSGKTIWKASNQFKSYKDKFKNLVVSQIYTDKIVTVTDKNLLILNKSNGNLLKTVKIENLNIDKIQYSFFTPNNDIFLSGVKGVARITPEGDVKYAINTKANLKIELQRKNILKVYTGSKPERLNQFVLMNVETGEVFGEVKDTPYPHFDAAMKSFIAFDGGAGVMKYNFR